MSKPSLHINVFNKTVFFEDEPMKLSDYSPLEFADHIVDACEHLWDADTCNDTRKELVNLYNAIMEA